MTTLTEKIQGYALYTEVGREDKSSLVQVFITPDGYTDSGQFVPARLYFRQLHSFAPKRQWKTASINHDEVRDLIESGKTLDPEQAKEFAAKRLGDSFQRLFTPLINGVGWKLVHKPIVVQVSQVDMRDIAMTKTPSKIVYRIQQVKKGIDFPEALVVSR